MDSNHSSSSDEPGLLCISCSEHLGGISAAGAAFLTAPRRPPTDPTRCLHPESRPQPLQSPHHFRAPTPAPGRGIRTRLPGLFLYSRGVGTVNRSRRSTVPPTPAPPPPGCSPGSRALGVSAPLPRRGHPIHPAAAPANHRAHTAPHLAMGRGLARRVLAPSLSGARARAGLFPANDPTSSSR